MIPRRLAGRSRCLFRLISSPQATSDIQFANQTLGLSVGYARYQDTGDATIRNGDYSNMTVNGATVSVPTHLKDFSNHKNESRDGFVGTLQARVQ